MSTLFPGHDSPGLDLGDIKKLNLIKKKNRLYNI